LLQPLARLIGRIRSGLTVWRHRGRSGIVWPWRRKSSIWSEEWHSNHEWLAAVEEDLVREGTVVRRGGDFDPWDLEVRGGLFGSARMLMGIEEHGAGKQLLRFRTWPKFSLPVILVDYIFTLLAFGAAMEHAWVAWSVLTLFVGLFSFRLFQESAAAESAILYTLEDNVKNKEHSFPSLKRSKFSEV
jgi:hypothetical protein